MPCIVSVFGVEPFRIGGTETYARELSLQLQGYGWDSVLVFLTSPSPEVREFLDLPNVSIEVLDRAVGLNWRALKRISRILKKYRPRILHLHYTGLLSPYPWLARLLSVEQVFFTDHASQPAAHVPQRASLWKRSMARLINWPLSKVICVSNYGYRCLTARDLFPADRCEMIYNGVDLTRVAERDQRARDFRQRFAIPSERKIVLQVSWIIPEKGIADLLSAARIVVAQNPNVHFVIVGEGLFRPQYMSESAKLGLNGHITWTGLLADPFTEGVYDAADIVCQVSRWEEVFGWVIAEAMAYHKPIIATRVGGIPELVTNEESGFLLDRGDVEELARKILTLIDDPRRRHLMGQVGYDTVQAKFDLQKNVTHLLRAYDIEDVVAALASL
ncbi:MAG: glycosyltransferase family 4 protein [Pyrinomonadaceae bacterium]